MFSDAVCVNVFYNQARKDSQRFNSFTSKYNLYFLFFCRVANLFGPILITFILLLLIYDSYLLNVCTYNSLSWASLA